MATNVPPELEEKFKRCKEKVMGQGNDESSAYGICYAAVVEGKSEALDVAAKAGFELTDGEKLEIAQFWAGRYGAKLTYAERQDLKDSDFVFPDERAFPVMNAQDVMDAVNSWGRYKGPHSFEDFKKNLMALCKRKNLMGSLPDKWTQDMPMMTGKSAIKAVGDWELDVLAIPFGSKDSDGQWFDANTDIMAEAFNTPLAVYQHGISQGAKSLQDKPIILGKTVPGTLEKKSDGWHLHIILDQAKKLAAGIMDAARKGLVAVSSGSISHLARLDIGGKQIMYEKSRPGRISVWPLAEVSLWEKGNGNMQPANRFAMALPAMKAIYRDAGLPFPDVEHISAGTYGASEAEKARRAKIAEIQKKAQDFLKKK